MSGDGFLNTGPKSGDLPSRPSKKTERERQIVAAAIEGLKKEFPIADSTDINRLVGQFLARVNGVREQVRAIDDAARAKGVWGDRQLLREETEKMFLTTLANYNKDELHLLFTCVLTDMCVKELV